MSGKKRKASKANIKDSSGSEKHFTGESLPMHSAPDVFVSPDSEIPAGEESDRDDTIPDGDERDQIESSGSVTTRGKRCIHCLTIIGQIEGHYELPPHNKTTKYEHMIPQIVAIEENPEIEGLLVILNTAGGDIEAGLALAELIAGMRKPTVSLVLGGGHSIGVPLAVSSKRSFIAPTASMTIHPVRMSGIVLGVPQTLTYFQRMQERITGFISDNSGISQKKLTELMLNTGELTMDMGTVLSGAQAVKEGLIDELGSLGDAIECLYEMIDNGY